MKKCYYCKRKNNISKICADTIENKAISKEYQCQFWSQIIHLIAINARLVSRYLYTTY